MKLVEIKNSLVKLYYEPSDFRLALSDFLTIDDGNQKLLAQVVSVESTNKETTNCAVLKLSLDLNDDGSYSTYGGYVPPLDSLVSKTPQKILKEIFFDENGLFLGELSGSLQMPVTIKPSLLENFLYIQADKEDNKTEILTKILNFYENNNKKALYLEFKNSEVFGEFASVTLGNEFKLPISTEILNYIYENDLTGLTLEQKTIVQDIIIEIQDYIDSLEDGFIPFNTLLEVVNEIYETDKSVGVILFRNKLLKYKQAGIFASSAEEIYAIEKALQDNAVTVLKLSNADKKWQSETLSFVLNFLQNEYALILEADDEILTKEQMIDMYKLKNVMPIVLSAYDSNCAGHLKSFAKNLILFKPLTQQRAFATYNSFLNKLAEKEFIVSGESTFYTPLIIKELPDSIFCFEKNFQQQQEEDITQQIQEIQAEGSAEEAVVLEPLDEELEEDINNNFDLTENEDFEQENLLDESDLNDVLEYSDSESSEEIQEILEETIEQQIAKDVDGMFYAENQPENDTEDEERLVNIDVDLYNTEAPQEDLVEKGLFAESPETTEEAGLLEEDLDFIDALEEEQEIAEPDLLTAPQNSHPAQDTLDVITEDYSALEYIEAPQEKYNSSPSGVPVYKTELDDIPADPSQVDIAEGNIVYHEKYGRGVVEQFMSYGNKTFCSILFDNVGRRLMDPKIAGLKQM